MANGFISPNICRQNVFSKYIHIYREQSILHFNSLSATSSDMRYRFRTENTEELRKYTMSSYGREPSSTGKPNEWILFLRKNGRLGKSRAMLKNEYKVLKLSQNRLVERKSADVSIKHMSDEEEPASESKRYVPELWYSIRDNIEKYYNLHFITASIPLSDDRSEFLDWYLNDLESREKSELKKLLVSHIQDVSMRPKWLFPIGGGACSFRHLYSARYRKSFYIIGEYHENEDMCKSNQATTPIATFLKQFADSSPSFLDIFIEHDVCNWSGSMYEEENEYVDGDGRIGCVVEALREFTKPSRRERSRTHPDEIQGPLALRVHMTDMRAHPDVYENIHFLSSCWGQDIGTDVIIENWSRLEELLRLATISPIRFAERCLTKQKDIGKPIGEIIRKIWDGVLPELKTWLVDTIEDTLDSFPPFVDSNYNVDLSDDNILEIKECIFRLTNCLMDFYTLRRMFKTFTTEEKDPEQPKECHQVIYYAGDVHCEAVEEFLLHYLYFNLESKVIYAMAEPKVPCPIDCQRDPGNRGCAEWFSKIEYLS